MKTLISFLQDESGNSVMQYCFLSGAITAVIAEPLHLVGQRLAAVFMIVANALAVH